MLMKLKDYRLKTVLKIRENAKDEAGRTVARRLEELDEAEQELTRKQSDLLACYEQQDQNQSAVDRILNDGARARSVLGYRSYLNDLRERENELKRSAEKQRRVVERAENEVDAAKDILIAAVKDHKAIETHRSQWLTAQRTGKLRIEQKLSDELGGILAGRRRQE